jgi:hypothetical protein
MYISDLKSDKQYSVIKEFIDYDNIKHNIGKMFIFISYKYFPYDSGYTINIKQDNMESKIRLEDHEKMQKDIIRNVEEYFFEIQSIM